MGIGGRSWCLLATVALITACMAWSLKGSARFLLPASTLLMPALICYMVYWRWLRHEARIDGAFLRMLCGGGFWIACPVSMAISICLMVPVTLVCSLSFQQTLVTVAYFTAGAGFDHTPDVASAQYSASYGYDVYAEDDGALLWHLAQGCTTDWLCSFSRRDSNESSTAAGSTCPLTPCPADAAHFSSPASTVMEVAPCVPVTVTVIAVGAETVSAELLPSGANLSTRASRWPAHETAYVTYTLPSDRTQQSICFAAVNARRLQTHRCIKLLALKPPPNTTASAPQCPSTSSSPPTPNAARSAAPTEFPPWRSTHRVGLYALLLLTSFGSVACSEEAVKLMVVRCAVCACVPRRLGCSLCVDAPGGSARSQAHATLALMLAAGVGFAMAENLLYVYQMLSPSAVIGEAAAVRASVNAAGIVLRNFLSMPLHAICACFTGVRLVVRQAQLKRADLDAVASDDAGRSDGAAAVVSVANAERAWSLARVLAPAAGIHGTFDSVVFISDSALDEHAALFVTIPLLVAVVGVAGFALRRQLADSWDDIANGNALPMEAATCDAPALRRVWTRVSSSRDYRSAVGGGGVPRPLRRR